MKNDSILDNLLVADYMGWQLNYNYPDKGRVYSGPNRELELDTTLKFDKDWNLLAKVHQKCCKDLLKEIEMREGVNIQKLTELNAELVRSTKGLNFDTVYRVTVQTIRELKAEKTRTYVILGAPGSGKGTQSKMLAKELNLVHISTGDLMRKELKEGTDLGLKIDSYTKNGHLTPDELAMEVLEKEIAKNRTSKGFVLDGFPRKLSQVSLLDQLLHKYGFSVKLAIGLDISGENVLVERIKKRALDSNRKDDVNEDIIRERLKVYQEETKPLISLYYTSYKYDSINGEVSPEEVFSSLLKKCS